MVNRLTPRACILRPKAAQSSPATAPGWDAGCGWPGGDDRGGAEAGAGVPSSDSGRARLGPSRLEDEGGAGAGAGASPGDGGPAGAGGTNEASESRMAGATF